jgi:hypothetical protein
MSEVVTVQLDATDADLGDVSAVAKQVPDASTLAAQTRVRLPSMAFRRGGMLRKLLGPARVPVDRAARCTALLVCGYVGIGADDEAAWGIAP